ncbi:hypothetical protein [Brachybacterium atlanticum]|uniref:hypothetical protein n=1 Tax=Brachybacterium atlanticum TaxID=2911888 RepID=UPI0021E0B15A|nr:hypothetical protein [Brachybacterium atlanticum]
MSEQTVLDPPLHTDPPDAETPAERKPRKRRATGAKASAKRGRPTARTAKATLLRIASKAEEIAETDDDTRLLAAELTGAETPGIADLTTTIMSSKTSPLEAAVADLTIIQAGTLPEAVVHLVGMSQPELQALTRLVTAFSTQDLPGQLPAKSTDAALMLVEPVRAAVIDDGALQRLIRLLAK